MYRVKYSQPAANPEVQTVARTWLDKHADYAELVLAFRREQALAAAAIVPTAAAASAMEDDEEGVDGDMDNGGTEWRPAEDDDCMVDAE